MSPWLRATYSAQARLSERGFRASRPVVRCGAVGSHRRSSRLGRLRTLRSRCLTAAITEVCPCWRLPNLGFRAAGSSVRLMFRRRPDRAHLFQRPRVSSFERESRGPSGRPRQAQIAGSCKGSEDASVADDRLVRQSHRGGCGPCTAGTCPTRDGPGASLLPPGCSLATLKIFGRPRDRAASHCAVVFRRDGLNSPGGVRLRQRADGQ